jgi:uncharacterized protein YjiS (DUF1127 family)
MSYQATLSSGAGLRQSSVERIAGVLRGSVAGLARRGGMLFAAWRGRTAVTAMAGMSTAELRDIGLLPGDLLEVRHLPYGADPTEILARVAAQRTGAVFRG